MSGQKKAPAGTEANENTNNGTKINLSFEGFTPEEIKSDAASNAAGTPAPEPYSNPYPVDCFPEPFRQLITEAARCLNYPPDYTGTAIIAALSLAVGKTVKLKVKAGWYDYPAFYTGIIGPPGASKTHPLKLAFAPFEEIDREAIAAHAEKQAEYEEWQALSKKDKKDFPPVLKPVLRKNVLPNFTPEVLYQRLADNEIGCALVADELATFLEGMNNYSKGDQTSVYLSIWSNAATSIDRVSKPVPLWLPLPFLTITGGLQPRVLKQLFPPGKTNNGFIQRFLFAYPANAEKQAINDNELDENLTDAYSQWIRDYRKDNPVSFDEKGLPQPKIYQWSGAAKAYFYSWQNTNTEQVNEGGGGLKAEILSKYDNHFCRLALLMQVMMNSTGNEISEAATIAADRLCSYYQNAALHVLRQLGHSDPLAGLPINKQQLFQALPASFTTAEANTIGDGLRFNVKAVQRFLRGSGLFQQEKTGHYTKKVTGEPAQPDDWR